MVRADDVSGSDASPRMYLVGFMGAGKSTVGARLAERLACPFVELDDRIEERADATIPELFRTRGEEAFRDLEHRELRRVSRLDPPRVIACGGGVPLFERNRRILSETGRTVCLRVSPETALKRVGDADDRPLFPSGQDRERQLKRLWEKRQDAYNAFEFSVDTDDRTPAEIVDVILEHLDGSTG